MNGRRWQHSLKIALFAAISVMLLAVFVDRLSIYLWKRQIEGYFDLLVKNTVVVNGQGYEELHKSHTNHLALVVFFERQGKASIILTTKQLRFAPALIDLVMSDSLHLTYDPPVTAWSARFWPRIKIDGKAVPARQVNRFDITIRADSQSKSATLGLTYGWPGTNQYEQKEVTVPLIQSP